MFYNILITNCLNHTNGSILYHYYCNIMLISGVPYISLSSRRACIAGG